MRFPSKRDRIMYTEGLFRPDPQWYGILRPLPIGTVSAVIDLGSHAGLFSLMARFLHPTAKVLAVEPHAETFQLLKENVDGLQIVAIRAAFGNGNPFALSGPKWRRDHCTNYREATEESNAATVVPSHGLRKFLAMVGDPPLSSTFWKIDVEGAEVLYISGDNESVSILANSLGFVMDIHADGMQQWELWRERLHATHSLECWHKGCCCTIAAKRDESRRIKMHVWKPERVYEEVRIEQSATPSDFDHCLPWLTYESIIWLLLHTQPSDTIFEWGGGASTLFFRGRGHQVTTVEHNAGWARIAGVEPVWKRSAGYVSALDRPYDVVLVDGRRRDECFAMAVPFVRKCLVLDDSNRPENARLESLVPAGWTTLHLGTKARCNPKRPGKTIDSMTSIFVPPYAKMDG